MKRSACCLTIAIIIAASMVPVALSQVRLPWRGNQGENSGGTAGPNSQSGAPQAMSEQHAQRMREFQQRMEEMQRQAREMERQAEESRHLAIRQALGADEEQYRRIRPKLKAMDRLKAEANAAVDLGSGSPMGGGMVGGPSSGVNANFQGGGMMFGGGFAGGGGMGPDGRTWSRSWSWGTPSAKSPMEMTDGEVLCDELLRMLHSPTASPAQIAQKVEALRQLRARARRNLAAARQELRKLLKPNQQLILVAMGYLE